MKIHAEGLCPHAIHFMFYPTAGDNRVVAVFAPGITFVSFAIWFDIFVHLSLYPLPLKSPFARFSEWKAVLSISVP